MMLDIWVYLVGALIIAAAIGLLWFVVGQTPMRYMIAVTIRYRLIRVFDYLSTIGRASRRFRITSRHSYEELFDTALVIKALNQHYQNEIGLKWTDLMAEEGVTVSQDIAGMFVSCPEEMLNEVSLHLCENRFRVSTDPYEIHDFLREEQQLMAENPDESLGHPRRLWKRFGRGPIYGWRTPLFFANGA